MSEILYIIAPAYNEEENIARFVGDWYPVVAAHDGTGQSRLVIINDGSKDQTEAKIRELEETHPLLLGLTKENGGHGDTILYGYHYAIEHGADWVFQTDSDGQTNAREFEGFWERRQDCDAIIGERNDRQDGRGRVFVENVLRTLLRFELGVRLPDANAPFRLMKASLLEKHLQQVPEHFFLANALLTALFVYYKENVSFMPISFGQRQGGENSINYWKIMKTGVQALKDFSEVRKSLR